MLAPICLFAFSRPQHLATVLEALLRNDLSSASDLYIFCDGAKQIADTDKVRAVCELANAAQGFKSVTVVRRNLNLGLSKSIISGLAQIFEKHQAVIVLEDDVVPSKYFLQYMNDALDKYESDDRVISISAYSPIDLGADIETYFLRGADCWGWATWSRGWEVFNSRANDQLIEIRKRRLQDDFDFDGAYKYSKMLKKEARGEIDSWAICWHASAFLANKLTLYPGRSLIVNIGQDGSGTHRGVELNRQTNMSELRVDILDIEIEVSETARTALKEFYYYHHRKSILRFIIIQFRKLMKHDNFK